MSDYVLLNNEAQNYYYFEIDGHRPRAEYLLARGKIYLAHTEVPNELSGKGIASALVKQVLEDIEAKGLPLIPLCPYVAAYIKRHPEWFKVLDKSVNIG